MERTHEKYQRLLDFCKALPPTPTAVAHPCDESSLRGAVDAAKLGLIAPILVGPRARIEAVAKQCGLDIAGLPIVDTEHSHDVRREGRRAGARRQGGGADEGQPAYRRTDGRGGQARHRAAHCTARQPLLRDGRPDLRRDADRDRRGDQHRAHAGGQGRHHPERDRPRPCAAVQGSAGRDPVGDGNRQSEACHRRSRPPRCARWPTAARSPAPSSMVRWRSTTRSASSRWRSRRSTRRSPDAPTFSSFPISRPATCWPRACRSWRGADAAGIVLGARVPIILTSRADSVMTRLASCAVAVLVAKARRDSGTKAVN